MFVCLGGGVSSWSGKWSEITVRWQVFTLRGHTDDIFSVAFFPDGKRIVSGSEDKLVKIWDAATGAEVSRHGGCTLWSGDSAWAAGGQAVQLDVDAV